MKKIKLIGAAMLCGSMIFVSTNLNAAETKSYQVTGPVLEIAPTMIAVMKGKDRWELSRDQNTKVTGDLKVGAKVTISYKMVAQEIEAKVATEPKAKK